MNDQLFAIFVAGLAIGGAIVIVTAVAAVLSS